ncbi:MAG: hypothetical protein ACI88H_001014 [Cocleimonas sp.]|jgi:hypothetical protein
MNKKINQTDFWGGGVNLTTIKNSTENISCTSSLKNEKVMTLFEQRARKKRIEQSLIKCLGLSLAVGTTGYVHGTPGDLYNDPGATLCETRTAKSNSLFLVFSNISSGSDSDTEEFLIFIDDSSRDNFFTNSFPTTYEFGTYSTTRPTTASTTPITDTTSPEPVLMPGETTIVFLSLGANSNNDTCTYSYTLASDAGGGLTRSNIAHYALLPPDVTNPAAVPLFTPIGLVATISGLLWFGRRRKAIKFTNDG